MRLQFLVALGGLIFAAAPVTADAVMGGTGIWKHDSREAWLIYLDWYYISNSDGAERPSIALYDKDSGDGANVGAVQAEFIVINERYRQRITLDGCDIDVEGGNPQITVSVGEGIACDPYRALQGNYSVSWTPPE
ncbi:MAG: hypothetical protein IAE87_16000 [Rhodobacteraceae bacterium]|nr:hypothetical protein [Paracoccaceae bacterium]